MKMKSATYYISSLNGNDNHDGMSEKTPFCSLKKISQIKLNPGDRILLEKGSVFCGEYLHIKNCGDIAGDTIEIASYGTGNSMPCIAADGSGIWYQDFGTPLDNACHQYKGDVSSAVLLYDCENIVIRDIEITNRDSEKTPDEYSAAHKIDRTGLAVVAQNRGTLHNIVVDGLFVHDVNGNVYNKHMNNGGIYMTSLKPADESRTGIARYDGVTVRNCFLKRVSRWGIAVGYTYRHKDFATKKLSEDTFKISGNENVLICGNYVKYAGGDAITPMYVLRPLVEHNVSDSCACEMNDRVYRYPEKRMGKVAAAIWPWKCKDAHFRLNEAVDTKLNQDGMAYDADSGDGTVYEYNYSRLNEGGCIMFCLQEAVNNTFSHNLSYDDLGGTISPVSNPDALVANNRFFVRKGVPFKRRKMRSGKVKLKDNEIITIKK